MVKKLSFTGILIVFWEIIVKLKVFDESLMPSFLTIMKAFIKDIDIIMKSTAYSIYMILIAFIFVWIIVILLLLLCRIKLFEEFILFLNTILHPLPGVALLIVIITWFGIGSKGIFVIMIHSMLWPVFTSVYMEVKRVHQTYNRLVKGFHLNTIKTFLKIYLPGTTPGIISGSKTGWSRGWRAFISAEMIMQVTGSKMGLGRYLFENRIFMDIPSQYAGLLAIIVVSILIEYSMFTFIEKHTIRKWAI